MTARLKFDATVQNLADLACPDHPTCRQCLDNADVALSEALAAVGEKHGQPADPIIDFSELDDNRTGGRP
jgi:hypothetical protein